MKKKIIAGLIAVSITACNADPLSSIQKDKVNNDKDAPTWGQLTEQFKYCQKDSKKWELEQKREDKIFFKFSCQLNAESIAEKNKEIEEAANKDYEKRKKQDEKLLEQYIKRRDANRKYFKEYIAERYPNIKILDGVSDDELDKLAIEFYQKQFSNPPQPQTNPIIKSLLAAKVEFDVNSFFAINQDANIILNQKPTTPPKPNLITSAKYKLSLVKYSDKRQPISKSEEAIITFTYSAFDLFDEKTNQYPNPYGAHYLINNQNPIGIYLDGR